jgi:hypothetical protein
MMKRITTKLWVAGTLAVLLGAPAAMAGAGDVGTQAADFTLTAFGGGSYTLSDYRDKVVLLNIMGYG